MKIIVASYPKTGTKSLNAALTEFGYLVYDCNEHFFHHEKQWKKILTTGGSVDDFKEMYKDVDVIMDVPVFRFWEEIHWAFPDAKIILMLREEDSWYRSMCVQITEILKNNFYKYLKVLTPTGRKYWAHFVLIYPQTMGILLLAPWKQTDTWRNAMLMKQKYRQHNDYVIKNAPKEKLLVYDVKEGWDPLCKFLHKDLPNKSFPYKNVRGEIFKEWMREDQVFVKMKKEFWIIVGLLTACLAFGCFKLYKQEAFQRLLSFI